MKFSKQTSIKASSRQKVLAVIIRQAHVYFKKIRAVSSTGILHFYKKIIEVLPNRPFYAFIVSSTKSKIYMPSDMVIGKSKYTLSSIAYPVVANQ